jgi:hypothetical protein
MIWMHSLPILPIYNITRFADFLAEFLQFPVEKSHIPLSTKEKNIFPEFSSGATARTRKRAQ